VQEGDSVALAHVYDKWARMVHGVSLRITGSLADAEDVTQTVFVGLPLALQRFEGRGSFEGWLRRIAVTTALKVVRAGRREVRLTTRLLDFFGPRRTEDRIISRLTIHEALTELEPELRTVLVLKEVEGYSHREIAELLDITPENSMVRLCRARKRLRALL
jgi:RNA polymerase sigma-70 factor, ECF subfamily